MEKTVIFLLIRRHTYGLLPPQGVRFVVIKAKFNQDARSAHRIPDKQVTDPKGDWESSPWSVNQLARNRLPASNPKRVHRSSHGKTLFEGREAIVGTNFTKRKRFPGPLLPLLALNEAGILEWFLSRMTQPIMKLEFLESSGMMS